MRTYFTTILLFLVVELFSVCIGVIVEYIFGANLDFSYFSLSEFDARVFTFDHFHLGKLFVIFLLLGILINIYILLAGPRKTQKALRATLLGDESVLQHKLANKAKELGVQKTKIYISPTRMINSWSSCRFFGALHIYLSQEMQQKCTHEQIESILYFHCYLKKRGVCSAATVASVVIGVLIHAENALGLQGSPKQQKNLKIPTTESVKNIQSKKKITVLMPVTRYILTLLMKTRTETDVVEGDKYADMFAPGPYKVILNMMEDSSGQYYLPSRAGVIAQNILAHGDQYAAEKDPLKSGIFYTLSTQKRLEKL